MLVLVLYLSWMHRVHLLSSCASSTPLLTTSSGELYREQCGGSSEAPENRCRISWSSWYVLTNLHWLFGASLVSRWVQSSPICDQCRHNLHNCPAGWWARNAAVIVPKLAEIGDNYEFVNQFRPLWSAGQTQDVKFCDEKTERPFLSQQPS